jgi:hypothetical protein
MASALSIQSPFLSFLQCDPETITRRRPMMSNHGDPFTLLNLFDEWIYVKSDGQNTRTWCKRRGVEEQRLYDITKLRRQFQDILRVGIFDICFFFGRILYFRIIIWKLIIDKLKHVQHLKNVNIGEKNNN